MGDDTRLRSMVYVIDDDASVRRSIERLLRVSGYECQVFSGAKAYWEAKVVPEGAACLVLDIRMPDITGTELQELLHGTAQELPIVFVTGHGDIPTCVKTLKAGAVGFLTKPFDEHALLDAVGEALRLSERWAVRAVRRTEASRRFSSLSPRERDVFGGVVRGLLNKQIADELGIAEKTVKVHRARVMEKMAAESVADLVRLSLLVGDERGAGEGR